MVSIEQIKSTYEQIKPLLEDERVKRYGTMLIKAGKNGAKKVIGHIETTRSSQQKMISSSNVTSGVQTQLAGNMAGMTQQLIQKGCSSALGGLTSLSWANLAVSGINLGVTVAGMIVISKKIDTLTREVQQMNGKLDAIIDEMHQIKAMVAQLNDNEIRKLYSDANKGIRRMKDLTYELNIGRYNDALRREAKNQLIDSSVFLEDIFGRYTDFNCNIALGLDVIMAYFYTFVSLMKTYISTVYLYDEELMNYAEYEDTLRNLCSKSMIESIQNIYRESSSSFVSPQDLGLITAVYKGIMVEQISEIKSQRQILELVDYNEYKRINEQLQSGNSSGEIAFVQYAE